MTSPAITHWKKRFVARGLAGLHDEDQPGRSRAHDDEAVAELLAKVLHEKPDGTTHWSVRSAAAQTGISKSSVARYLSLFGVQLKLSTDPVLRREGARYCRAVPEPTDQCARTVRRREEPVPGAGAHAAGIADGSGLPRRGDA